MHLMILQRKKPLLIKCMLWSGHIFHAAGDSGNGAIEALKEQNKWVIGVDRDQNDLAP